MAEGMTTRASDWMLRIAGLAPLAALYFLLPARNHTEAEDSIPYIMRVSEGAPSLHPNHLLFEPVGSLALAIFRMFGHQGSAEIPMQMLNTLGALAALLMATHLVASRATAGSATPTRATLAGLLTAYAIGVCFGFWHYATEAETYLLPFAFASLALALFADAPLGKSRAAALGLAIAAAILLHQKFVFFGALAGLWLLFSYLRGKAGQQFLPVLLYAILSVGPVLIAYIYAYSVNPDPDVPNFLSWARGYASDGLWDPPSALTPVKAVVGFGSSIVTLNVFFSLPGFADTLSALFAGKILLEERYLAETFIPLSAGLMILASFVLAALLAAFAIFRAWRTGFQAWTAFDRFLLLYILAYTLLVCIWEPFNREFWIHIIAVALILFGRRARWHEARISSIWGVVIALLFAGNLIGAILPMSSRTSDYWYASNERLITTLAPGDVIISDCGWICGNYLTFYAGAAVLAPSFNTPEHLEAVIGARPESGALYLSSWALSPPEGLFIASEPGTREAFLVALRASYAPLPELGPDEAGARTQRFWKREGEAWALVE